MALATITGSVGLANIISAAGGATEVVGAALGSTGTALASAASSAAVQTGTHALANIARRNIFANKGKARKAELAKQQRNNRDAVVAERRDMGDGNDESDPADTTEETPSEASEEPMEATAGGGAGPGTSGRSGQGSGGGLSTMLTPLAGLVPITQQYTFKCRRRVYFTNLPHDHSGWRLSGDNLSAQLYTNFHLVPDKIIEFYAASDDILYKIGPQSIWRIREAGWKLGGLKFAEQIIGNDGNIDEQLSNWTDIEILQDSDHRLTSEGHFLTATNGNAGDTDYTYNNSGVDDMGWTQEGAGDMTIDATAIPIWHSKIRLARNSSGSAVAKSLGVRDNGMLNEMSTIVDGATAASALGMHYDLSHTSFLHANDLKIETDEMNFPKDYLPTLNHLNGHTDMISYPSFAPGAMPYYHSRRPLPELLFKVRPWLIEASGSSGRKKVFCKCFLDSYMTIEFRPEDTIRYVDAATSNRPWFNIQNLASGPTSRYRLLARKYQEELRAINEEMTHRSNMYSSFNLPQRVGNPDPPFQPAVAEVPSTSKPNKRPTPNK